MHVKLALGNVRKSIKDFGIYFVTILLGVAIFYAFNSITDQQAIDYLGGANKMMELLGMVINGVSVFIVVILAFLVIYANRFLIKRRKKEFGLYLCLGMRQSDVVAITAAETLIVGAVSLLGGLALGALLSQGLLMLTASLFKATVPGFAFGLSEVALVKTLIVFVSVFLLTALANSRVIMKAKLIDLMHAESQNEEMKLRNIPLSIALFAISCVLIGVSYKLLLDNGLTEPSPEFAAATVLVCIGTVLFFYSLSGFLLRLVQLIKPLYLRGLNMFTLRQVGSKVNTTFLSMSVICITLFLAITSVCGGIGICNTMAASIEKTTPYDALARTIFGSENAESGYVAADLGGFGAYAASIDYDMERGLRESAERIGAGDFDALVEACAQVDYVVDLEDNPTFADLDAALGRTLIDYVGTSASADYGIYSVPLLSLSQFNESLSLAGKPTVELAADECLVISDSDMVFDYYRDLADKRPSFDIGGSPLTLTSFMEISLETTPFPLNTGAFVVPDESMPESTGIVYSALNVKCPNDEAEAELSTLLSAISQSNDPQTWPLTVTMTRQEVYDQNVGLSTVVAYLAIYIGFVLVMACAAILAIQQLSEASDNARRYGLLRKLGTDERMVNRSILLQVAIYFAFPLVLAIAHSVCALLVVTDVVAIFGALDIGRMALMCAGAFLLVYGAYFALTYQGAKRLAKTS